MTHKQCNRCKQVKETTEFYKNKRSADGLKYDCRKCEVEMQKERYKNNPDSRKNTLERHKRWKEKNPEKYKESAKKAEANRRRTEKRRNHYRKASQNRRSTPIGHLRSCVSRQVVHGLKRGLGSKHGQPVFDALSYSPKQLKEHLEKQFDDKMSWDNYGSYWHIDHIVPHSSFHYTSMHDEAFKKCWALENLRPLEAIENIKKGNKIIT